MSKNLRMVGIVLGCGAGAAYFAPSFFNPARTPAVQSIEGRYTAGGASPDGERAQSTKRGDQDNVYTGAESRNQERLREQKADLLGSNTQNPKGDNKVVGRAPPEERPRSK